MVLLPKFNQTRLDLTEAKERTVIIQTEIEEGLCFHLESTEQLDNLKQSRSVVLITG